MSRRAKTLQQIFVVIRLDKYDVDQLSPNWVMATKAYWTLEEAELEATRLNQLNSDENCEYFTRVARIPPKSARA